MGSKQALRNKYLSRREMLSPAERTEKSEEIRRILRQEPFFCEAANLLVYMDYRSEVITSPLVEELLTTGEKRIYAPMVKGMDILFYQISSMQDLFPGYQGIREPRENHSRLFTRETAGEEKSLILVPGAVFDRERGRIGYGKGFYDRYLGKFSLSGQTVSAALAFECQIAAKVPMDEHDLRVDMIITEKEIIR